MKPGPWLLSLLAFCVLFSCKAKPKKDPAEAFFPVLDVLRGQVKMVDTSIYPIVRFNLLDTLHRDTEYIHRDRFRSIAHDFLEIPDLADADFSDRYTETRQFDEGMNRVIITYTPKEPAKEIIQSEQVLIEPGPGGDKINNIIINTIQNTKDSSIEKKMLWKVDQLFQITTIRQLPGQPEQLTSYKVTWNEHDYE